VLPEESPGGSVRAARCACGSAVTGARP
jgi:hypothetical protein